MKHGTVSKSISPLAPTNFLWHYGHFLVPSWNVSIG